VHHKWVPERVVAEYALPSFLMRGAIHERTAALHQVRKFKDDLASGLQQSLPLSQDRRNLPNEKVLDDMDSHQIIGA